MNGISFVISSVGTRDRFIDEHVIPSITKQGMEFGIQFEIVIAGCYNGISDVIYVPAQLPVYFYKHFQKGVEASKYYWIVDMDDDMVLADDWYTNLVRGMSKKADIYGFRLLNPDGTVYCDVADAFGTQQKDNKIRYASYFGCYIAKKSVFEIPWHHYPTYMSGDRHHGLMTRRHKRIFLPDVRVVHHGAIKAEGAIPRASAGAYQRTMELRDRLGMKVKTTDKTYEKKMRQWWQYSQKLEKPRKKIGIWGWFGHDNVGDDLILDRMRRMLDKHDVSVYTDRPDNVSGKVHHTEKLQKDLNKLDMLLVGGGGVLHERAITKAFPQEMMEDCQTPVVVYAAGIPFFDWCENIDYFLSKCYLVTLRDKPTLDFFQSGYPSIPAMLLPDPVFTLPSLPRKVPKKIVLNIREVPKGWYGDLPEDVNEILIKELETIYHYLRGKGYSPLVLGFEPRDKGILFGYGYRTENYKMVSSGEAIMEIASAELLIGTRYHAGVIAATQGTPAIMINYQKKIEGLSTLVTKGIKVVDVQGLDLVREFEDFNGEYDHDEVQELGEAVLKFNSLYIDYGH